MDLKLTGFAGGQRPNRKQTCLTHVNGSVVCEGMGSSARRAHPDFFTRLDPRRPPAALPARHSDGRRDQHTSGDSVGTHADRHGRATLGAASLVPQVIGTAIHTRIRRTAFVVHTHPDAM